MHHKPTQNSTTPQRRGVARRIVVIIIIVCVIVFCYRWFAAPRFDSARWKASKGNDESKLEMVDDLLANYELIGLTRSEIDNLLGKPPKTNYFAEYDYVYWLGPERTFFSIDSEWLGIKFNDDVVADVQLLRD